MPRLVREHEILRVAASILGNDPIKSAEAACREILIWAQKRSGDVCPVRLGIYRVLIICLVVETVLLCGLVIKAQIYGLSAQMIRIKKEAGRIWTTEVVVGLMDGRPAQLSARLLASTTENQLEIEPHVPGFVQQVSEACGLACGPYKLSTTPWLVDSEYEADRLIEMLLNPHRRLPVFVLTVPENADNSETPLLNADELTRATLGMAHVVIVPPKYTWAISNRFGRLRSVFGGAVRAYLAGFTEDADPYGHRLILGDNIASPEGQMQCMRWMRSLAASESIRSARLGQDVLAFADIKNASLRLKQQRLEQEGASDSEQLEAAKAHIKALEKQIEEEKSLQQAFSDEHAKAEERAVAAERQMSASAFRIQQLIEQLIQRGETPDTNIDLPTTWSEFTEWCDTNLAGRVVLAPVARRGVKSAEFEDVRLVARCLIWLANDCRNWRMEGGKEQFEKNPSKRGSEMRIVELMNLTWIGKDSDIQLIGISRMVGIHVIQSDA